ncbi:thiol reductant ABC exporter subunit CydC [Actinoplanes sp. NPDC023936]|uniref:thiol reductant ABC exporter subunit CydC n=1 Tax=Actinoplanes sp. NPDC023936 TaxID=3154910 RepID=UPI003410139C
MTVTRAGAAPRTSWLRLVLVTARPALPRLLVSAVLGAGAGAAGVGLMACAAWLISRAALHPPVLQLMVAIVAVRAFGIGRGVLRYLERLTGHDAAFRALVALRVRAYRGLAEVAPGGLAGFRRGDLAERLTADVDAVLDVLVRVVLPYAAALLVGVGSVALAGTLLPAAGLALAVALIVLAIGVPAVQAGAARRSDGRLAPLRGELATHTVDLLHGLPDLTAFGATGTHLAAAADADRRLRAAGERSAATAGLGSAAAVLVTGACVLAGLIAGAAAVRAGTISGELLAVVTLTPLAVAEAVSGLPAAAQRLAGARAALRRVAEVVDAAPPAPDPADPVPLPAGPYTLRLHDVTAGWADPAVRGLDLTLAPGRRVALAGPSGAGKSTVAALLVRFLDPQAGRVTLNGTDLRDMRGADVRRVVGLLDDRAYLFDTGIAANLRVGRPGATEAELWQALAAARLEDWVRSLPAGLDTEVGEHGMAVSGGERRRLALARLLLADPPVLVLDEPAEHLDEPTAAALTADLLDATHGRTVLLITHREADLSGVDEVIRLPGR